MMNSKKEAVPNEDELLRLAGRQCDNTITTQERQRLEELLTESLEARRCYLHYLRVNADLLWLYRTGSGLSEPTVADEVNDSRPSLLPVSDACGESNQGTPWMRFLGRPLIKFGLAAAVLLGVAFAANHLGRQEQVATQNTPSDESLAEVTKASSSTFVATLLDASAVVWSGAGESVNVGARVGPGDLWLESGDAELLFDSGAKLVLSGPSRMVLQSSLAAHLESGAIVAHMPESAIGFKLSTMAGEFVDQGTEFGVVAEQDGTAEVHVFRGQVDVQARDATSEVELSTGEAMRLDSARPTGEAIAFSRERFGGLDLRVASPLQWSKQEGGNDHYYELVVLKHPITWHQAAADAMRRFHQGMPGHLVTVTSHAEDQFLIQSVVDEAYARGIWIGLTDVLRESDFRWITGEEFGYSNWATYPEQQPDNYREADWHGGEDYGMYTTFPGQQPWAWNDLSIDSIHEKVSAYIVEYEPPVDALKHRSMSLEPVRWEPSEGGKGQRYELVLSLESVDWETIRRRAEAASLDGTKGHLAVLETEEERNFVIENILRVCGIPEIMIGLTGGPESKLEWVNGRTFEDAEFGKPFLPTGKLYGLLFWDHKLGRWDIQTRSIDSLPSGWFGFIIEYP